MTRSELGTPARWRVDLHIHTCYSPDSLTRLEEVIAAALKCGLGALAVTDHDAMEGALALSRIAPFPVVVGEEIDTGEGEITGLFLNEFIPPGLGPERTVNTIRAQGGLVYVPHPFDRQRRPLGESGLFSVLAHIDVIEVLNARVRKPEFNNQAARFAREHGLPGGAGSDAHTPGEIGQAYVEMDPFVDRDSFMASIARANVAGSVSGHHVHLYSTWAKLRKGGRTS